MTMRITPLGDVHNGKQTELIETEKIKYIKKPRDCKTEVAFSAFIDRLCFLGFERFSRAPIIIESRSDYHTEVIEENLPTDENGIDHYYYRVGILLFICYLFSSIDMHCENIIASGDMPILVDMETLMSGKLARMPKVYNLSKSVMCSHLLCNFASNDNKLSDVSGISGTTAELKNIPHTAKKRFFVWEKSEMFIRGFEYAYRFFSEHKENISLLLNLFDNCRFRQILRPTATYYAISEFLNKIDVENREATALNILSRAYNRDVDKNRLEKSKYVLKAEVEAVLKKEIPLFYTKGNSKNLSFDGYDVLNGFLELSPIDFARERLAELSVDDLERQKKIIKLAVLASTPINESKSFYVNTDALAHGEIAAKIVSNCQVPYLPSVFTELRNSSDGSVFFGSSGLSLYSGLMGVLCMYAAMYRKTEKKVYLDNLLRGYDNVSEILLTSSEKIIVSDSNVSLSDGISGIIASQLHIFELIGDKSFFDDAFSIAKRISIFEEITNFDYLGGAGALPIMLSKLNMSITELCDTFSENINMNSIFTTGMAHGAAGLALTSAACGVSDGRIVSLLEWENSKYSEDDKNWFDLRDKTKKGFMSGWCSGAPGIGMARQEMKKYIKNLDLLAICNSDIERAKSFLQSRKQCKRDSLCCGSSARLMAASRIGIELDYLYDELATSEQKGNLRFLHPADTADINVSLMQGYSGVAYALAMYGDSLSGGMLL